MPLLGDTIGDNFDRTVATRSRPRGAGRGCRPAAGGPTPSSSAEVDAAGPRAARRRRRQGRPGGHLVAELAEWTLVQYATAKIGAILVNVNPAYRTHELAFVLQQSGVSVLVSAPAFKTSDYGAMVERGARQLPGAAHGRADRLDDDWDALLAAGRAAAAGDLRAARQAALSPDDPINIQYTSGTTGFPKGATLRHHNILNNGFFVGERLRLHRADRVCIPVPFYHCFGMVMGNLACTTHGATMVIPAPGVRPDGDARGGREPSAAPSLYGVPTMFIAELSDPDFAELRPVLAAHRDHGRLACPVEVMKRGHRRDAHDRGDDLLRHDRDLAGVHPDPSRRPAREARRDGRAGASARRGQDRRPGDRRRPCRAASPASCAPAATR